MNKQGYMEGFEWKEREGKMMNLYNCSQNEKNPLKAESKQKYLWNQYFDQGVELRKILTLLLLHMSHS